MKKATVSAILTLTVFLCSCSAADTPKNICVNRNFSARMTLHYNETAYTADFESDSNGCSAVFLSPEEIKGLTIILNNNETIYSLDGLTFSENNIINRNLPLDAVLCALDSPIQYLKKDENGYTLCGSTKYGNYIMNINNNYIPNYIEYNSEEITVKFNIKT